jgi:hypothetical protein
VAAPPTVRNLEPVLSLGALRYFTLRGKVYAVPPVSFKLGQRVLDLRIKAISAALSLQNPSTSTKEKQVEYYKTLQRLSSIMGRNAYRVGGQWKILRALRLTRNPFSATTEEELMEIADFFLQGRTKSSVQFSSGIGSG